MPTYKPDTIWKDDEGRQFRLIARTDPRGPIPAYWQTVQLGTGRHGTIREDRITDGDYTPVTDSQDDEA